MINPLLQALAKAAETDAIVNKIQVGPTTNFTGRQQPILPAQTPRPVSSFPMPSPMPTSFQQPTPSLPSGVGNPEVEKKSGGILAFLKQNPEVLLSLASIGIGLGGGSNNAMAGAAGLTSGFTQGKQRHFENDLATQEQARKNDLRNTAGKSIFTIDENGQLVNLGDVPKGSQVVSPQMTQTPEQRDDRAVKLTARRELNKSLPGVSATLQAFRDLEKYAKALPDFKPGVVGQTVAKGQTAYGNYSANKTFTDFEAASAKAFAPATRSILQEVGTLNEGDIERSRTALGRAEIPLNNKLENINNLRSQLIAGLENKLVAAGLDWEDLKTINPSIYNEVMSGGSGGQQSGVSSFNSEQEAMNANLAPGTKIMINGRPAVWE